MLKNKYNIKEKIKQVGIENCFVSEITIAELKFGAEKRQNYKKHAQEVKNIQLLFKIIPIYDCLDEYAKEKCRLQKKGILIPDFDLLIGVTSTANNLVMVSNNEKHLARIKNIRLENWTKTKI